MSVRPPQGEDDSPDVVEFGIAALAGRIDDAELAFPVGRDELVRALGDPDVPIDAHGNSIALSTAIEDVPKREFDSERDLLNALHPVFESHRNRTSTGLLGSIRSLFPF